MAEVTNIADFRRTPDPIRELHKKRLSGVTEITPSNADEDLSDIEVSVLGVASAMVYLHRLNLANEDADSIAQTRSKIGNQMDKLDPRQKALATRIAELRKSKVTKDERFTTRWPIDW
jgi:hypothetical protein